jgi:hypothetical protein
VNARARATRKSTISIDGSTTSVALITFTGRTLGPFSACFITKAISISIIGLKNRDIAIGPPSGMNRSSVIALMSGSVEPDISCIALEVRPTL